ncbi:MAG: YggS family pyridoxal phosphate-dependent enzyme [Akkermansiaceae bacterium]|nr:YggS family pyridoxal phosphate-dependent enzyme [Akkermansiaceae bacterium]
MSGVAGNLREIRRRIDAACGRAGRDPRSVELVAVSKTFDADAVRDAVAAGQTVFGESRLQEAEPKIADVGGDLEWHFIGSIQRNKVRRILGCCRVLHSVDSLRLARYVSNVAENLGVKPGVFLQVNQAGEESKGGLTPEEIRTNLPEIATLESIELLGLMVIPPAADDPEVARHWFQELRELRDELAVATGIALPCLSMGMSDDFEIAVEEGATHVRVGSAIFGARSYRVDGELG